MEAHKVSEKDRIFFSSKWLKLKVSFSLFNGEAACYPCMTADSNTETFTVWTKSLIMQGNGLTVFNGNGQILYRIDNYDQKSSSEVFLMDLTGKVLFTIRRKRIWFLCSWEGYENEERRPLFRVKKVHRFFSTKLSCDVKLCRDHNSQGSLWYKLEGFWGKTAFRIVDSKGGLVAEAERKQSSLGVQLGEDVLSLVLIKTHLDHSLIMALVAVYQLIQHRM